MTDDARTVEGLNERVVQCDSLASVLEVCTVIIQSVLIMPTDTSLIYIHSNVKSTAEQTVVPARDLIRPRPRLGGARLFVLY